MARGWESKSVEDQIADKRESAKTNSASPLTPAQIEKMERIRSLKNSLAYIEQQITESRSERHRLQLGQARMDIVKELEKLKG
jgi:hypothetical protein